MGFRYTAVCRYIRFKIFPATMIPATPQRIRFDYFAAVNGEGEKNLLLKPGDIIVVP